MKHSDNTILITGGATGIGLALAVRFLKKGNEVIICGRRQEKLDEAKRKYPGLHTCHCDVSQESERVQLFSTITRDFPKLSCSGPFWKDSAAEIARSIRTKEKVKKTHLITTITTEEVSSHGE